MNEELTYNFDQQLIDRFALGETQPEEELNAIKLIKNNAEARNYFLEIAKVIDSVDVNNYLKSINTKEKYIEFIKKTGASSETSKKELKIIPLFLRIAAVILIVFGILKTYQYFNPIKIDSGNEKLIAYKLPDNSIIDLNKNTTIKYSKSFGKKFRKIKLIGEAYFDVQSDENIPFIVDCEDISVEVVGTSFNVFAFKENNEYKVSVDNGVVEIINNDNKKSVKLYKGEEAIYNKEKMDISVAKSSENNNAWKTAIIKFNNTTLDIIAKVIEKEYEVNINIIDIDVDTCRLTAMHKIKNIDTFLNMLQNSCNIEVIKKENLIIFKGKDN